jgi:threonine aldolase
MQHARRWRKILGGGMRQAGVIAAAALYALENNIERLKEDHEKAKFFAEEISKLKEIEINMSTVQTNIIIFSVKKSESGVNKFKSGLEENRVLISDGSYGSLRAVFHLDVSMEQVKKAVDIFKKFLH